jgi:hypothetical protein
MIGGDHRLTMTVEEAELRHLTMIIAVEARLLHAALHVVARVLTIGAEDLRPMTGDLMTHMTHTYIYIFIIYISWDASCIFVYMHVFIQISMLKSPNISDSF